MRTLRRASPPHAALAALLALATLASPRASACSICRCGDATFNALGPNVYSAGAFRLALDWERFDKENATSELAESSRAGLRARPLDVGTGRDEEVENRFTAALSYSFGERVNAVVRLPWSSRHLTESGPEGSLATRTSDLSDPEVYALVKLWSSGLAAGMGKRAWLSLLAGVKTPWGRNDVRENGERLDEHAQPGTGSTDVFGGLTGFYLLDTTSSVFASLQYRRTGTNDFDYRYGDVTIATAAYEHKLGSIVDGVVELDYRHAQQDRVGAAGARDPNTGGDVVYATPRVMLDVGRGLVARLSVQVPVVRSLYGDQRERLVANAGLTYLFP